MPFHVKPHAMSVWPAGHGVDERMREREGECECLCYIKQVWSRAVTSERLMLFFEFDILRGSKVRACIAVRFPPTI